jgi:hypothetical protein
MFKLILEQENLLSQVGLLPQEKLPALQLSAPWKFSQQATQVKTCAGMA